MKLTLKKIPTCLQFCFFSAVIIVSVVWKQCDGDCCNDPNRENLLSCNCNNDKKDAAGGLGLQTPVAALAPLL